MTDIVICFDIGGTLIKGALIDKAGNILYKESIDTCTSLDTKEQEASLVKCTEVFMNKVSSDMNVIGLAMASPGVSDKNTVLLGGCENIEGMHGLRFSDIGDRFSLPTKHENDASTAALGEVVYGAGKGSEYKSALLITLGTGVGGGLVFDGHIYRGSKGYAGEIGHTCVIPGGLECNCGSYGCLEQYSSANGYIRNARQRMHKKLYNTILTEEDIIRDKAKSIFDAAKKGDQLASDTVSECSHILGMAIAHAMNMLDLDLVLIGGGLCKDFDMIIPHIDRALREYGLLLSVPLLTIKPASLGNDAGVLGCAALFFHA